MKEKKITTNTQDRKKVINEMSWVEIEVERKKERERAYSQCFAAVRGKRFPHTWIKSLMEFSWLLYWISFKFVTFIQHLC